MTDERLLAKYNAVKHQLENCGRQVMNLRNERRALRDVCEQVLDNWYGDEAIVAPLRAFVTDGDNSESIPDKV